MSTVGQFVRVFTICMAGWAVGWAFLAVATFITRWWRGDDHDA